MLEINCITLIFGNLYFSPNTILFIRCVWPFHNSIFIDTFYQWVHGTLL